MKLESKNGCVLLETLEHCSEGDTLKLSMTVTDTQFSKIKSRIVSVSKVVTEALIARRFMKR